jgi:hypothetical protein
MALYPHLLEDQRRHLLTSLKRELAPRIGSTMLFWQIEMALVFTSAISLQFEME